MIIKITYEPETLQDAAWFLDDFCDIELRGKGTCVIESGFSSERFDEEE